MFSVRQLEKYLKLRERVTDPSSTPNEQGTARRICAKMRANTPGIHEAALAYQVQQAREAQQAQGEDAGGGYPSGPTGAGVDWKSTLKDWFADTVSQVARGLSQADKIERDVAIDVRFESDRVVVVTEIPLQAAIAAAREAGGSLQEYARLVGLQIGRDLSEVFEDHGY
jgi:hypothetical protein